MKLTRAFFLVAFIALPLVAQRDSVVVRGTLQDTLTGRPVVGAMVEFAATWQGRGSTDSMGHFTVWSKLRGPTFLRVHCPHTRGIRPGVLDSAAIDTRALEPTPLLIRTVASRCIPPAYSETRVEVSGYWLTGFKTNHLTIDKASWDTVRYWGGSGARGGMEVLWTPGVSPRFPRQPDRPEWPNPLIWSMWELWPTDMVRWYFRPRGMTTCFRVQWAGRLLGPGVPDSVKAGRYYMLSSPYRFIVDTSRKISLASDSHCEY